MHEGQAARNHGRPKAPKEEEHGKAQRASQAGPVPGQDEAGKALGGRCSGPAVSQARRPPAIILGHVLPESPANTSIN